MKSAVCSRFRQHKMYFVDRKCRARLSSKRINFVCAACALSTHFAAFRPPPRRTLSPTRARRRSPINAKLSFGPITYKSD